MLLNLHRTEQNRTEQNRTEHILFPIKGPQGAYRAYMNKEKEY